MDLSNLLSHDGPQQTVDPQSNSGSIEGNRLHQYRTRHSLSSSSHIDQRFTTPPANQFNSANSPGVPTPYNMSPVSPTPKNIAFELLFDGAPNCRARLPMRVQIFPHDTTDSIVTTVKNFYGLYEGAAKGVSFEDDQGNTLIARYENFRNNMVVHVRVIADYSQHSSSHLQPVFHSAEPVEVQKMVPLFDEASEMLPPQHAQILHYGQSPSRPASRPASRASRKHSASPKPVKGSRPVQMQKSRSRSGIKSRGSSVQRNVDDLHSDAVNGYSDSDGGAGSMTSSRKARSEQLTSAEISVDNIITENRRKRAKFESSELPLFVPPQVPAPNSVSSISPQRHSNIQDKPSPFARPAQRSFTYNVPLQSPQSYGQGEQSYGNTPQSGVPFSIPSTAAQHRHRLRDRTNTPNLASTNLTIAVPRQRGPGILPTPDPTIASCISDEDVALQLMRLGDASNISNISHGRTSASTFDDAFSGKADVASSATSESGNESDSTEQPSLPARRSQSKSELSTSQSVAQKNSRKNLDDGLPSYDSTEPSGDEVDGDYEYDDKKDLGVKVDSDDLINEHEQLTKHKTSRAKSHSSHASKARSVISSGKVSKSSKPRPAGISKKAKSSALASEAKVPLSPASLPPQSRKTSTSTLNFQHQLGVDEEDLSSKPRCQRCRKSKKGCDRQRPCQRCKDAGIGIEGCVSEDEGNGRKGRYGRHMGVPVKRGSDATVQEDDSHTAGAILTGMASAHNSPDKNKKRKR